MNTKKLPLDLQLLEDVENYLKRSGMSPSAFSMATTNSPTLVSRLREGKSVTGITMDRVYEFMAHHPPPKESPDGTTGSDGSDG